MEQKKDRQRLSFFVVRTMRKHRKTLWPLLVLILLLIVLGGLLAGRMLAPGSGEAEVSEASENAGETHAGDTVGSVSDGGAQNAAAPTEVPDPAPSVPPQTAVSDPLEAIPIEEEYEGSEVPSQGAIFAPSVSGENEMEDIPG